MKLSLKFLKTAALAASALAIASTSASADVLFWSTQAKPVEEAQAMRDKVLAGAGQAVDYQPGDPGPWLTRLQAEIKAGKGTIGVLGSLHGSFTSMPDDLADLSDLGLKPTFSKLGMLGTKEQKYITWMQATYIMGANKKALEFLPEGADINALSYDQLIAWSKNMAEKTGSPKFGFPSGPQRPKAPVLPRLFVSFLYQFSGSQICVS